MIVLHDCKSPQGQQFQSYFSYGSYGCNQGQEYAPRAGTTNFSFPLYSALTGLASYIVKDHTDSTAYKSDILVSYNFPLDNTDIDYDTQLALFKDIFHSMRIIDDKLFTHRPVEKPLT